MDSRIHRHTHDTRKMASSGAGSAPAFSMRESWILDDGMERSDELMADVVPRACARPPRALRLTPRCRQVLPRAPSSQAAACPCYLRCGPCGQRRSTAASAPWPHPVAGPREGREQRR